MGRSDKPEGVRIANAKLDQAVREYIHECAEAWEEPEPRGVAVGWVLGVAMTRFGEDGEDDALIIESSPGINNYMARGLADATAESFQAQASGWGEMEDDE